jgi:hypothetical protein
MVSRPIRKSFRHRTWIDLEEVQAEATAAAIQSHRRIHVSGKDPSPFLGRVAALAVSHVHSGRHVGGSQSSTDVLSGRAQRRHGFRVLSISNRCPSRDHLHHDVSTIADHLRESTLRSPVCEAVAFRVDFPQFLATLSRRDRAMALFLAVGNRAKVAARDFGLSAARISQLRHKWQRAWLRFQSDPCELAAS